MAQNYIGSRISLISKAKARYEGTLLAVDVVEHSMTLEDGAQQPWGVGREEERTKRRGGRAGKRGWVIKLVCLRALCAHEAVLMSVHAERAQPRSLLTQQAPLSCPPPTSSDPLRH